MFQGNVEGEYGRNFWLIFKYALSDPTYTKYHKYCWPLGKPILQSLTSKFLRTGGKKINKSDFMETKAGVF